MSDIAPYKHAFFGSRNGQIMLGPRYPLTAEKVQMDMSLWLGRPIKNVDNGEKVRKDAISIMIDWYRGATWAPEPGALNGIGSHLVAMRLLQRLDEWDDVVLRHLQDLVVRMERAMLAGNNDEAMMLYLGLRDKGRTQLARRALTTQRFVDTAIQLREILTYSSYRICCLEAPYPFDWTMADFMCWVDSHILEMGRPVESEPRFLACAIMRKIEVALQVLSCGDDTYMKHGKVYQWSQVGVLVKQFKTLRLPGHKAWGLLREHLAGKFVEQYFHGTMVLENSAVTKCTFEMAWKVVTILKKERPVVLGTAPHLCEDPNAWFAFNDHKHIR